jgi:hypothetical protein
MDTIGKIWKEGTDLVMAYPSAALGLALITIGRWIVQALIWLFS